MTEATVPAFAGLPAELMVYNLAGLRQQWLADLDACAEATGPLRLDASAVDEVDAAGVQLLMSLAASLQGRGRSLQLVDASRPLRDACLRLDTEHLLAGDGDAEDAS